MRLSLLIVLATGLGLVLFVWAVFATMQVANRVIARSFWCRFRRRNVSAEFCAGGGEEGERGWCRERRFRQPGLSTMLTVGDR
jgi:hypothetical protein